MKTTGVIAGAGIGAGLMFVLDPERGRRRRALVRDKVTHLLSKSDDLLGATARDMANRTRGVIAEARTLFGGDGEVSDEVLAQRVRTELGHWVSHPGSIEVDAREGRVTLRGVILKRELDPLPRAIGRVRGVREVDNQLEAHDRPDDVPGLQGGVGRSGRRFELFQSSWSPTARVILGAAGAALAASAVARRQPLSMLLGGLGLGMLARAASNVETRRLIGAGGGRQAIDHETENPPSGPVDRPAQELVH